MITISALYAANFFTIIISHIIIKRNIKYYTLLRFLLKIDKWTVIQYIPITIYTAIITIYAAEISFSGIIFDTLTKLKINVYHD